MFEAVYTFGLPNNAGPTVEVQSLALSDSGEELWLEAWGSAFGSSNVHILKGQLQLAEAQGRMNQGMVDFLFTVPAAGVARRRLPSDMVGAFTVFFENLNTSGQFQLVTIRVTSDR